MSIADEKSTEELLQPRRTTMRNHFLIHAMSHTFLVVDIAKIGLPNEIYPTTGKQEMLESFRFQSSNDTRDFFLSHGADDETIDKTFAQLRKTSVAVLAIL